MFYTPHSFTWHTYEESQTKTIEQHRRAYRWEEGHCLQCCHFKRRECIIQPLLCTGEENLHEHQGYYQHMWRVERSADQSQSGKKKKKKEENVKKKEVSCLATEREDAWGYVRNGPFGYTASETCNEDAKKGSFCAFFFSKRAAEDKENTGFI